MTFGNTATQMAAPQSVSATLVQAFVDFAVGLGADPQILDKVIGTRVAHPAAPEAVYSLTLFRKLIAAAKQQSRRSDIVLRFAAQADYSELALSGLIANASATMVEALEALNKYARLTFNTPFKGSAPLHFRQDPDADWIIDQRLLDQSFPELIEISFTFLITGPMTFLPEHHVEHVYLAFPEPDYADAYRELWQTDISFAAEQNALRLPKWVADHPVRLQPEYAKEILAAHADQELQRHQKFASFSDQVRHLLNPALSSGDVSIHWLSERLSVSRQTIYRRLKKENVTFERILDRVREDRAIEMLSAPSVSITAIAYELGFSDASAFSRAFRRWTGMFPTVYRAQNLNRPQVIARTPAPDEE